MESSPQESASPQAPTMEEHGTIDTASALKAHDVSHAEADDPIKPVLAAEESGERAVGSASTTVSNDSFPPAPPVVPQESKGNGLGLWLRDIVVSAAISVLIITFLYQPVRVEGTSMLPRLEDHDRLFINKFVYRISSIHRGDVVVFHYPRDPEKSYIKRVIALPGDRIFIDHGRVFLNGKPLREPYVPDEYRDTRSMAEIVVPEDAYFMMGDHRSISSDSREFGPVDRDLIYGKAVFVYWPTKDAGVVE